MREPIHHFFMFRLRDYYFSALAPRSQPRTLELSTNLREVSQLRILHYAKQMLKHACLQQEQEV